MVYNFQSGLYNESYYGEYIQYLDVRIGEHTGISPLTNKYVQPIKDSAACLHFVKLQLFSHFWIF